VGEGAGQVGFPERGERDGARRVDPERVGTTAPPRPSGVEDAESSAAPDATPETEAVREEIEQTRAEMGETIDAIQERLDPQALGEQAKTTAQEVVEMAIPRAKAAAQEVVDHAIHEAKTAIVDVAHQGRTALREATIGKAEDMARSAGTAASGWRRTLMETVKANPIPAALAGISLGWLYMNRQSGAPASPARSTTYRGGYSYAYALEDEPQRTGTTGQTVGRVRERAGEVLDQTQQKTSQAVDRVQETTGQVVGQVQDVAERTMEQAQDMTEQAVEQVQTQAHRAQSFLQRQLDENPLAVGAVALALGAALGASMRPTRQEDQLVGEARDRLMGKAQAATQDTVEKVEQVMDRAVEGARSAVEQEGGR
jgi:ElaB/YqjD/DUF883 family membrane-anchored ribosome-binding protein